MASRALALQSFCVIASIASVLAGCSASAGNDDPSEVSENAISTPAALSPLLADVLSGGDLRCASTVGAFNVGLAPARHASASSWRSSVTLAGNLALQPTFRTHVFAASDGSFRVASTSKGDATGSRSLDFGSGSSCGGGAYVGGYYCGQSRSDAVRFYLDGGALRCEVKSTMNEVWQDNFTYTVTASPIRLSNCFDEGYYLASNLDVAKAVAAGAFATGRAHFDRHGRNEGRAGCACEFNEAYYLANNPDVAAAVDAGAFLTGRHHYALNGAAEGRRACP